MPNICREQSCEERLRQKGHYLCKPHWELADIGLLDECPNCGVYKNFEYELCVKCHLKLSATPTNLCREQSCEEKLSRKNYYLCKAHWELADSGLLNECPKCDVYKDSNYDLCISCNKKNRTRSTKKKKSTTQKERATPRRYDFVEGKTFTERATALEDDQKARDKRQLFHNQAHRCVYCGNEYGYDELEIEHMIPKALGGQDNIRNCQLACKSCNKAKGTLTDIQFREKYAKHLPQQERQPANPPIDPKLLTGRTNKTRRFYAKRRSRR